MKKLKKVWLGLAVLMLVSIWAVEVRGEKVENLVLNPSFEEEEKTDKPTGWWCCNRFSSKISSKGSYVKDKEIAHSGNYCVMIEGKGMAAWIIRSRIKVKGNTTYEFSAWVKSNGVDGKGYNIEVLEFVEDKHTKTRSSKFSNAPSDWQKVTIRFTTIPTITKLELRLYCFGVGNVWFDDVSLVEIKETNAASNLIKNSSFENATISGIPDNWGILNGGIRGAHYTQKWHKWWGLDKTNAYDGKKSLRIYRPFNDEDPQAKEYVAADFPVNSLWYRNLIEPGNPYTFSVYMKSDTSGFKVTMTVIGYQKWEHTKDVKVDTSWKRYILTTPPLAKGRLILRISPGQKGVLWIDAAQFEKGEIASAYASSKEALTLIDNKDELTMEEQLAMAEKGYSPVPEIVCEKISFSPKIDGILDDECWQKAKKLELVYFKGGKPKERTDGYILQDEENLYIGMKCYESRINKLKTKIEDRDGSIWEDDCVEIFIDHNLDKETYYRVGVNAIGAKFDGKMVTSEWNGDWEAETFKGKDFWSLEMKLPFGMFEITPTVGDSWGINLCRTNKVVDEYSSWSPVYSNFHNPKRFGRINGLDPENLKKYCYAVKNISIEYENIEKESYNVVAEAGNYTGEDKQLRMEAVVEVDKKNILPVSGNNFLLKTGEHKKVSIGSFRIKEKVVDEIKIRLLEPGTKKVLASSSVSGIKRPSLMEVVPELNYYTDEDTASVFILSGLCKILEDKTVLIELKDKENKIISSEKIFLLKSMNLVKFKINKLQPDEYLLTAKLMNKAGRIISEDKKTLLKLEKKKNEMKINNMNRMFIVDGEPFLPFGLFWGISFGGKEDLNLDRTRKVFKALSLRYDYLTFVLWGPIDIDETAKLLDIAQDCNLKICICPTRHRKMGREEAMRSIERIVTALKDKPALFGWEGITDEVGATQEIYDLTRDKCELIKKLDPYHPTSILNNSSSFDSWKKFGFPVDIIELHAYNFGSPYKNGIVSHEQTIPNAGRTAKELRKPFTSMPQTSNSWQQWSRGPSAAEAEAVTYLSIVHGATIMRYYIYDQIEENLWNRIGSLGREIKELTPILASYEPEVVPDISVNSSSIHVLVKKYKEKYYLITVNVSEEMVEARFDLSSLKISNNSKIKVMFENRNISEKKQSFTDTFKGYQRHVYEIEP